MMPAMADNLKIGWASRDVTPQEAIALPGQFHLRISKGVRDPITLTALVVDNGADSVIFLSADIITVRAFLLDTVREKVAKLNPEIPVLKILMNATHTHTGPNVYNNTTPETFTDDSGKTFKVMKSSDYLEFLSTRAAEAVNEAWNKRAPGGVTWGYGYATVGHSRRVVYLDDTSKRPGGVKENGHGIMYGNTKDDKFSHYEAGSDSFVNLLYTFDKNGKLTGALINVPCPSQNTESDHYLSADFWHETRTEIRKKFGDIYILPQSAAAGDLAPRILHYKEAQARRFQLKYGHKPADGGLGIELSARKDIGERIAAAFSEVYDWARKDIRTDLPLKHVVETVALSRRMVTDAELAEAKGYVKEYESVVIPENLTPEEKSTALSRKNALIKRHQNVINLYELQQKEPKIDMELHVVKLGDIAFASNRFELYMDYMHRIQGRSPFEQTFVIQLAGTPGAAGGTYLTTKRGAANRGYGSILASNAVSPEGGQELVDETVKILKEIYPSK